MDGESAEVHLRLIAEAELRRMMMPEAQPLRPVDSDRAVHVADALVAVGALSRAAAEAIVSEFLLACAVWISRSFTWARRAR